MSLQFFHSFQGFSLLCPFLFFYSFPVFRFPSRFFFLRLLSLLSSKSLISSSFQSSFPFFFPPSHSLPSLPPAAGPISCLLNLAGCKLGKPGKVLYVYAAEAHILKVAASLTLETTSAGRTATANTKLGYIVLYISI
jgi:hypothetical protein